MKIYLLAVEERYGSIRTAPFRVEPDLNFFSGESMNLEKAVFMYDIHRTGYRSLI